MILVNNEGPGVYGPFWWDGGNTAVYLNSSNWNSGHVILTLTDELSRTISVSNLTVNELNLNAIYPLPAGYYTLTIVDATGVSYTLTRIPN